MRPAVAIAVFPLIVLVCRPSSAETLQVGSKHQKLVLEQGGKKQGGLWLGPDDMLLLRVTGPTNFGLSLRLLGAGKGPTAPVDLTVVRDDQEQGTVRFRLPAPDGGRVVGRDKARPSGEVLVKIEVPAGTHSYRVLVSGAGQGMFLRTINRLKAKRVIVATPGKQQVPPIDTARKSRLVARPKPAPPPAPEKAVPAPVAPPPDILKPVAVAGGGPPAGSYRMTVIRYVPEGRTGPGLRICATAAMVFLAGGGALLASASVIDDRARGEPVQIQAGELVHRSERTYRASLVMGGLALTSAAAALLFYLLETPGRSPGDAGPVPAGLSVRF